MLFESSSPKPRSAFVASRVKTLEAPIGVVANPGKTSFTPPGELLDWVLTVDAVR